MRLAEERALLCETGRRMVGDGLVLGTSGNVSVRRGDLVAVTPGGVALDALTPGDCPVLDLSGEVVEGARDPSSEVPMHLAIYESTGTAAIVHTHSTYAVVVSTTLRELPPIHYNTLLLGGTVRVAPYATYGTPELAAHVRAALEGRQAALMQNHGAVAVGADLHRALEGARLLEWLCAVYVQAKAIGEPRVLTEEELAAVIGRAAQGPRGASPPAGR
ncbi:fuculose phosphate aldolase [Sphaerisporangium siamense]|uniref:L-fuculose-phosphate aldolase n=1 Tax=Sphaerisporangium siamense TaxID=795645 RepID=A0A7W7GCI4_9ACTN|nr:class II aldolase/adducin family protein [Sphaerisporangium siamense]MBB4703554.1 L-fuculose-phosphate aldolase [Sphaerisporangium siamense]GII82025.1 fuculose phosphate aldolase [Sphaerisporangium siamense]